MTLMIKLVRRLVELGAEGEGWKVIDGAKTERRWLVFQARAPCVGTRGAVEVA